MKHKLHLIVMVIILIPFLFATAGCGTRGPMPTPIMTSYKLTETDNGKTINLNTGEMLVIRLISNPSTGYTWEIQDLDTKVLEKVGEAEFESADTPPDLVGASGTLNLTFKAIEPGTSRLTLVYHRPWEVDVEPIQTFSVTVTVK